ncbi:hypothetical protein BJX99DRAFT_270403 [Aspergillus californicus]
MDSTIPSGLIEKLRSLLPGEDQVLTPDNPGYAQSLQRWSDLACRRAGAVVFPESAQDVSNAITFAQENNIDLSVKGGGHTPDGGNSSDGGISIDLRRMNRVSVHPETRTLVAQGGALWRDVNKATKGSGFAVVSSSVGTTGVGGVTLQGGFGYLIGKHGLIIDNLLSVQIVTADGQLRTASQSENADLFWAIRGAGPNFGVVLEFTFRAHDQPDGVFAGQLVYTTDKLSRVMECLHVALQYPDGATAAQCVYYQPSDSAEVMLSVTLCHDGPEEECRERLVDLFALAAASTDVKMMPYEEANAMLDSFSPPGRRKRLIGIEFVSPLRPEFAQEVLDEFARKFKAEPDLTRSYIDIEFWNMAKVAQVPTTATAFPSRMDTRRGSISLDYTDPTKDEEYLAWGAHLRRMFEDEFRRGGFVPNRFVSNFTCYTDASRSRTPLEMFGVNGPRLVELKQKYDPQNIFNKLNAITI